MVTSSLITPKDVDAERNVVLEEIAMTDDEPSNLVNELFTAHLFGDTPLGRPILGTADSITTITRDQVYDYYTAKYTQPNLVIAAAGNIDHDALVSLARDAFGAGRGGDLPDGPAAPAPPRLRGAQGLPDGYGAAAGTGVKLVSREIEQANMVLGCEALARTDERRFALGVLNNALGGSSSSRLFQEIRDKRGLAYSVGSTYGNYSDTGIWCVYVGCHPSKAEEVLNICTDEVNRVLSDGISDAELARGKGQMRSGMVLGYEYPSSRMMRLGKSELVYPGLESLNHVLASINAVTHDDIRAVAAEVLTRPKALGVVGPFDDPGVFSIE